MLGIIDFDWSFIIKFFICFGILVIVPVWVIPLIDISFLWKILFTIAGAFGVIIALGGRTLGGFSGRQ